MILAVLTEYLPVIPEQWAVVLSYTSKSSIAATIISKESIF
ncbi:hypothetical protein UNH65_11475 [Chitinophaga sp. 180180018-2]